MENQKACLIGLKEHNLVTYMYYANDGQIIDGVGEQLYNDYDYIDTIGLVNIDPKVVEFKNYNFDLAPDAQFIYLFDAATKEWYYKIKDSDYFLKLRLPQ